MEKQKKVLVGLVVTLMKLNSVEVVVKMSHLHERVRMEKISEWVKFLQDLVPGCNKVTGKAVMLVEINYVQSL
ncbi:hypothetical protein WN944_023822 [Citrus x changshan-huyou]|uniref:BHLH domain-containing protein n=1 Tax=Citrus x changshan-huyou TaxID=2935761 RepID=A0AAP0LPE7_9ROSI